jgi:hypothetical protein
MAQSERVSRIVYPKWPETLTEDHLIRLFTVTHAEKQWVSPVARRGAVDGGVADTPESIPVDARRFGARRVRP